MGTTQTTTQHGEKTCPRCGRWITYIERHKRGTQIYYYAVHERRERGRRIRDKCYLGPERYAAAELFNPLGLAGSLDGARFLRYVEAIGNILEGYIENMDREKAEEVLRALRELNATLQRLEHKLEKKLEELK